MFASSLANGLALLHRFSAAQPSLSHGELAQRTGLSKSSITRLTGTLVELGFLRFDPEIRRYTIGSAAVTAGFGLLVSLSIRQVALPWMQAFADRQHGSVSMGMRCGDEMVYVETCRSHDAVDFRPDVGGAIPIVATAMGRAWLAAQSSALQRQVSAELRAADPRAWRCHRSAMMGELDAFASRGFCISRGDFQPAVHAAAVPLRSVVEGEVLVVNCGVPAVLLGRDGLRERIGPGLLELARRIDAAWASGPRG